MKYPLEQIKEMLKAYIHEEKIARARCIKALVEGAELEIIPYDESTGFFFTPCHENISFMLNATGWDVCQCPVCSKVYAVMIDWKLEEE